jgi:hypothetical protein
MGYGRKGGSGTGGNWGRRAGETGRRRKKATLFTRNEVKPYMRSRPFRANSSTSPTKIALFHINYP